MNCARTRQVLDAWLDGELDRATHAEIETHVQACATCGGLRDARLALRSQVRAEAPYFRAPAALASAARGIPGNREGAKVRRGPTWLQAGALAACFAVVFGLAGYWFGKPLPERS